MATTGRTLMTAAGRDRIVQAFNDAGLKAQGWQFGSLTLAVSIRTQTSAKNPIARSWFVVTVEEAKQAWREAKAAGLMTPVSNAPAASVPTYAANPSALSGGQEVAPTPHSGPWQGATRPARKPAVRRKGAAGALYTIAS